MVKVFNHFLIRLFVILERTLHPSHVLFIYNKCIFSFHTTTENFTPERASSLIK